jgi:hypothetical protein
VCALPSLGQDTTTESAPFDEPVFIVEEGAPPGFENLDLPQETLIDVAYGGRALAPAAAIYTESTIRFTDPEAIVAQLTGLLYPSRATHALTGPLASNDDQICFEPGAPEGCGRLAPDEAGVIFDASRFHTEIFVSRRLLRLS